MLTCPTAFVGTQTRRQCWLYCASICDRARRRSDQAGDAEVAHGFLKLGATGGMTSDKSPSHQTNNGDKALHKPEHMWQQINWRLMPQTPVGRAIVSATQRLDDAGSSTPNLDAQVILAHVLQVERSWLFAHYDYELTQDEAERYSDAVARRAAAEPVAYIVGKKEFYGLELLVDRRVLAPRPETEMLVDAVLDWIERRPGRAVTVADIGTGSGAIALAVAANCPDVTVYATDVSQEALTVAAAQHRLLGRPRPGQAAAGRSVGLAAGEGRHHRRQPPLHPQR